MDERAAVLGDRVTIRWTSGWGAVVGLTVPPTPAGEGN
jgi:hypothetical protein